MADQREVISALVALEFVVVAAVVFLLVPLDAVIWVVPLFLVLLFGLYRYLS